MAHACGCHHDPTGGSGADLAPVGPEETVGQIVARRPGALEVMQGLGINHCCGAGLTLREAAASAGRPLDDVVAALNVAAGPPARRVHLDVRGLEPPQPMVRVLEAAERLAPGGELEVRHDRRPTFLYPQLDERGFVHETDEPEPGLVRIRIRRGGP